MYKSELEQSDRKYIGDSDLLMTPRALRRDEPRLDISDSFQPGVKVVVTEQYVQGPLDKDELKEHKYLQLVQQAPYASRLRKIVQIQAPK